MKSNKLKVSDPDTVSDALLPEYRFDYSKARPNRFAARAALPQTTVTLAPDVAAAFPTEQAVNDALRRLMQTPEAA